MKIAVRVERYKDDPASWTQDNVMNGDDMNDIVLDMDLGSPEEDALLSATLQGERSASDCGSLQHSGEEKDVNCGLIASGQICSNTSPHLATWYYPSCHC